jgi:Uma2 family endonuclease
MPGGFLRRRPQLTMEQFHAFRDERPKEEKWELIDGVPMMMPPPTVMHVRIARNLGLGVVYWGVVGRRTLTMRYPACVYA